MYKQAVYDHVKAFMLAQGRKSLNFEYGTCMYIAGNSNGRRRCAIGCLLPSSERAEVLAQHVEGMSLPDMLHEVEHTTAPSGSQSMLKEFLGLLPAQTDDEFKFLCDLQWVHDERPVDGWEASFFEIADKHGLRR